MKKALLKVALAGLAQIIVCINCLYAQNNPDIKRTYHWYFGDKAGIDFSSGQAVADTNGQMAVYSGCSSMSDTSGNLLFYSDGKSIWNRNHIIMPNGTGLNSFGTPRQSSVIIPKPGSNSIYYIFTIGGFENGGVDGLQYSEVNMQLDSGNGDVTANKNIQLFSPTSEVLAATRHSNCNDYWVISHERYTNCFRAYQITEGGVDTNAIVTCIGRVSFMPHNYTAKFSPDGTKLCMIVPCDLDSIFECATTAFFELYEFNSNTGLLTNCITLPVDSMAVTFSFSPDNSKLYVESGGLYSNLIRVSQYAINVMDSSTINNSMIDIFSSLPHLPPYYVFGEFQISPDNKIIMNTLNIGGSTDTIGIIHNPNGEGILCDLQPAFFSLKGRTAENGLPNFPASYFNAVNCYSGLEELQSENYSEISVYPNPFNSVATINISQYKQFSYGEYIIYDLLGKQLCNETFRDNSILIRRRNLDEGMYLLKIRLDNTIYLEKIIITN